MPADAYRQENPSNPGRLSKGFPPVPHPEPSSWCAASDCEACRPFRCRCGIDMHTKNTAALVHSPNARAAVFYCAAFVFFCSASCIYPIKICLAGTLIGFLALLFRLVHHFAGNKAKPYLQSLPCQLQLPSLISLRQVLHRNQANASFGQFPPDSFCCSYGLPPSECYHCCFRQQ